MVWLVAKKGGGLNDRYKGALGLNDLCGAIETAVFMCIWSLDVLLMKLAYGGFLHRRRIKGRPHQTSRIN